MATSTIGSNTLMYAEDFTPDDDKVVVRMPHVETAMGRLVVGVNRLAEQTNDLLDRIMPICSPQTESFGLDSENDCDVVLADKLYDVARRIEGLADMVADALNRVEL